jgi:hypothetical protein
MRTHATSGLTHAAAEFLLDFEQQSMAGDFRFDGAQ